MSHLNGPKQKEANLYTAKTTLRVDYSPSRWPSSHIIKNVLHKLRHAFNSERKHSFCKSQDVSYSEYSNYAGTLLLQSSPPPSSSSSVQENNSQQNGRSYLIYVTFLLLLLLLSAVIFFSQSSFCGFIHAIVLFAKSYLNLGQLNTFANQNASLNEQLHYVLRGSENAPEFRLSSDFRLKSEQLPGGDRLRKCSHYSCFDIYRCGPTNYNPYELPKHFEHNVRELIKVHIYPNYRFVAATGERLQLPFSAEFTRILHTIVTSPYYTSDPQEACLFIVNLDLLNTDRLDLNEVERILWSLPHFARTAGANHLLYSMLLPMDSSSESHFGIDIGSAMVAAGNIDLSRYRSNFDISIPVYSLFSQLYESKQSNGNRVLSIDADTIQKLPRKWTLICVQASQISHTNHYLLKRLESLHSERVLLLEFDCSNGRTFYSTELSNKLGWLHANSTATTLYKQTRVCHSDRKTGGQYLDMLHNAEFCLILRGARMSNPLLSDALMSGCIPVIMIDDYVLPFEEHIDWTTVAVRVWEHAINDLIDIIDAIPDQKRRQLRANGIEVWRRYFGSLENSTLTTLDIINERIFAKPMRVTMTGERGLKELTPLTADFYSQGANYITPKQTNLLKHGFTTVILSFNRVDSLFEVIQSVASVPSCVKIIVVWNSQSMRPPEPAQWPPFRLPIQVILSDSNKLSNRFYPYASIETEAIFAIDDDITMLNTDEIEFGYQAWREFPDRIVGFPSRLHHWNNATQAWLYDSEWRNQISLILTGAAFYHNYYNHLYTHVMPAAIRDWVDLNMNCEDIAMNFLISNITRVAPIKVTPRKKFKCPECFRSNKFSALSDAMEHLQSRSRCINYFASIYQMVPLKSVEFRANPVLYRDNIPDKLKHFNMVGTL